MVLTLMLGRYTSKNMFILFGHVCLAEICIPKHSSMVLCTVGLVVLLVFLVVVGSSSKHEYPLKVHLHLFYPGVAHLGLVL